MDKSYRGIPYLTFDNNKRSNCNYSANAGQKAENKKVMQ